MKRSIALLLALTATLALTAVPVSADSPTTVAGTWDYEDVGIPVIKDYGSIVFVFGQDRGEWGGSFQGVTEEDFVVVCLLNAGVNFYVGEMTFDGTVLDESGVPQEGTMTLRTMGKQYSDTCEPSPAEWNGRWVASGGTGGLDGIRGRGTFHGPSYHLLYEGRVHFH